jgi:hypothetical protein
MDIFKAFENKKVSFLMFYRLYIFFENTKTKFFACFVIYLLIIRNVFYSPLQILTLKTAAEIRKWRVHFEYF